MRLDNSLLGKTIEYKDIYDPALLFAIPRQQQRMQLDLKNNHIPFFGVDIWNAYELSWLNHKGKPNVAIGQFDILADSKNIIESKSFKLYLNSLNNTKFDSIDHVTITLINDLSNVVGKTVNVILLSLENMQCEFGTLEGTNIDYLDIQCDHYNGTNKDVIKYYDEYVEETICSNLLKSNCLVTGQPDWGSVSIRYKGRKIDHASLLQYIVSYRNHNEFHEHCVERIFTDIYNKIQPSYLSVYARYTRRGGLDISPYRTSEKSFAMPSNRRLVRQ